MSNVLEEWAVAYRDRADKILGGQCVSCSVPLPAKPTVDQKVACVCCGDRMLVYPSPYKEGELEVDELMPTPQTLPAIDCPHREIPLGRWYPIGPFEKDLWVQAIGYRSPKLSDPASGQSREDSNLGVCCGNLSEARDILLEGQEANGLWSSQREVLKRNLDSHGLQLGKESALAKILTELDLLGLKDLELI